MPPPITTAWARSATEPSIGNGGGRSWVRILVMKTESIASATGMGAVDLAVTDGDRALRFYRDYVGLTPLPSRDSAIRLGAGARELVVLHPDAERAVVPRTSGLYHLALLVPDRRELARAIARLGRLGWAP